MAAPELIERFVLPLESLDIRYMVTGAVAAMGYGEPRLTNDVDVVVELRATDVARFVAVFAGAGDLYVPPAETIAAAVAMGARGSFNVIHPGHALKADFFVAADALAAWGLEHRRREPMGEAGVWLAPPEYVVVRKLEYFRTGTSAKHLDDIRSMLAHGADRLDMPVIEAHVHRLGLEGEWALARRPRGRGWPPAS
jgi:hypothetical protein